MADQAVMVAERGGCGPAGCRAGRMMADVLSRRLDVHKQLGRSEPRRLNGKPAVLDRRHQIALLADR